MPQAKLGLHAMGEESSYGVTPASLGIVYPIFNESITSENAMEVKDVIVSNLEYKLAFTGDFNAGGSISYPFYYKLGGYLLKAFFGQVDSTLVGTSAYEHTFSFADTLPSYSLYIDRVTEKFIYPGAVANKLSLKFSQGQAPMIADVDWICKTEEIYSGSAPTASIPNEKVFRRNSTIIKLNGTQNDYIKEITINLENNIDTTDAKVLTSGRTIDEPVRGAPKISGSFTARFKSMNEWKLFWGSDSATSPEDEVSGVSLQVYTTGDLIESSYYNKLDIVIPNVILQRRGDGTLNGPGPINVTFDFEAIYDSAEGYSGRVILTNEQASY